MKIIVVLISALSLIYACGLYAISGSGNIVTESRDVRNFNNVVLKDFGRLQITQGDNESLTIEADDNLLPYIKSDVVGNTLVLEIIHKNPVRYIHPSNQIKYYLTVKELENIKLSGSGSILVPKLKARSLTIQESGSGNIDIKSLTADELFVDLSGSGFLNLENSIVRKAKTTVSGSGEVKVKSLSAEELTTRISGSSKLNLKGKIHRQEINLSGSGDYYAADLKSKTTTIEISGSGTATVKTDETLDVVISGSGNVNYYGKPRITSNISGSGHLTAVAN